MIDVLTGGTSNDVTFGFQGSYVRSVTKKGRFNLPFRFRQTGVDPFQERWVVADGPDGTLCLMPHVEWVRAFQHIRNRKFNRTLRDELRRQSHNSEVLTPDSQGRLVVNPETLARYQITDQVLVLGMGHYLELWNPKRHAEHQAGLPPPDPDFMDEFWG